MQLRIRGILIILVLVVAIFVVLRVVKGQRQNVIRASVERIREMESGEVSAIEKEIADKKEAERSEARRLLLEQAKQKAALQEEATDEAQPADTASVEAVMAQIESGEVDVWSLFDDLFILGDSRSEPFAYYELVDPAHVFAVKGLNLRRAEEGIDQAVAAAPGGLIFTYGLNDANGNWASTEDFIAKYESVIDSYKAALPEAKIYISSIVPVTQHALSKDSTLEQIPAYNEKIKELCEKKGYYFIECGSLLSEHEDLFEPDGQHFTKPLYDEWAKLMIEEVLKHDADA